MDFLLSTPLPPVAISIAAAMVLLGVIFMQHKNKNKKYPVVASTIFHLFKYNRQLHHYMTDLSVKYRTFRILGLFRYTICTADPANLEYVLKTNVNNYGKGTYWHGLLYDFFGDGIFTVDGENWKQQRKSSSTQFSTKIVRGFSSEVFKKNAVKLAGMIREASACGKSIDMHVLYSRATFDSIVKVLLGIDLDTMLETNNEGVQFSNAIAYASGAIVFRVVDIFWRIKRFLNIGTEARVRKSLAVLNDYTYNLINIKIQNFRRSEALQDGQQVNAQSNKRDFISKLVEAEETDPKYLRDMLFSFVSAGKDTTTAALAWFMYMMCKHLDIQEKVAQEVIEATGVNITSSADEVAANLTDEALRKMHYLHAALNETLRLYPTIPLNARECFSDDTWPDGNSVKKGELVMIPAYVMGRMKHIWGDDAEEFRPERWIDENGHFRDESPFKFITFNAGRRSCPGKDYTLMQMKILAAVLFTSFKFKLTYENRVVTYRMRVTLDTKGLQVHAFPRV